MSSTAISMLLRSSLVIPKKAKLSGEQAALILSQVNFKIKMEEISSGFQQEEHMLKLIEKEAGSIQKDDYKELSE